MFGVIILAALLATLVSLSQEHAIGNPTCQLKFLKSLNETARLKQECGCVTFSDCCQVCDLKSASTVSRKRDHLSQIIKFHIYILVDSTWHAELYKVSSHFAYSHRRSKLRSLIN